MGIGIILDIIIIVFFALSIWMGYRKGLTQSLLKIFTFILAIIISFILFKPIANLVISKTEIDDNIQYAIIEAFKDEETESESDNVNDSKSNSANKDMPSIFYNYIEGKIEESATEAKELVIKTASEEIAIAIVNIATFIILFIVLRILLIFVKAIANIITKIPVIKQCDELGGGIYGALRAAIIILIIFTILSIISPLISESGIIALINQSILAKLIYENNIIIQIIL